MHINKILLMSQSVSEEMRLLSKLQEETLHLGTRIERVLYNFQEGLRYLCNNFEIHKCSRKRRKKIIASFQNIRNLILLKIQIANRKTCQIRIEEVSHLIAKRAHRIQAAAAPIQVQVTQAAKVKVRAVHQKEAGIKITERVRKKLIILIEIAKKTENNDLLLDIYLSNQKKQITYQAFNNYYIYFSMMRRLCDYFLVFLILFNILEQCKAQPSTSDSCIVYNADNSVCTQCLPGLYLQFFFCLPCAPLCYCSSDQNYCEGCLNITYNKIQLTTYRSGQVCVLCNHTIPFCLSCNQSGLTCSKCYFGRYVQDGVCSNDTCVLHCQICANKTHCQYCQEGYTLDLRNFQCNNFCPGNCSSCDIHSKCLNCSIGFFVLNGSCFECLQNCAYCRDADTCQVCLPSYIPSNNSCISTGLSNCIQYTGGVSSPTCLVCQPGYYNSDGSCTQCSGCLLCNQAFLCLTPCLPGYRKFNYACLLFQKNWYFSVLILLLIGFMLLK